MIDLLDKVEYIFQIPLTWFRSVASSINKMRGDKGISVDFTGDFPIIKLGDRFYNYRPIDCAKPTFDESGNLTNIEFYQVMAFCALEKINSNEVTVEEC